MNKSAEREPIGIECSTPRMFWQGALPRKFANFKVQNEECHYYASMKNLIFALKIEVLYETMKITIFITIFFKNK
jgi:hypothetical protein